MSMSVINYKCGKTVFSNEEAQQAVKQYLLVNHHPPFLYEGNLYSQDHKYPIIPIRKGPIELDEGAELLVGEYFVVFDDSSKVVIDVLAKLANQRFIKCPKESWKPARLVKPSSYSNSVVFDLNKGYLCGTQFISDMIIIESIMSAISTYGYGTTFPRKFNDKWIWPIYDGNKLHRYGEIHKSSSMTYCIFANEYGHFESVEAFMEDSDNHISCERTFKKDQKPVSRNLRENLTKVISPEMKYMCGKVIFNSDYLSIQRYWAQNVNADWRFKSRPLPYQGLEAGKNFYLWPINPHDNLVTDKNSKWVVVLSESFNIVCAAVRTHERVECCNKIESGENL